jgi:hypothetical protein
MPPLPLYTFMAGIKQMYVSTIFSKYKTTANIVYFFRNENILVKWMTAMTSLT